MSPHEVFDKAFTLHMSPRQKAVLQKAAKDRGCSVGAVLRDLIDQLQEKEERK